MKHLIATLFCRLALIAQAQPAPLAQQYVTEWQRLWDEGSHLPRAY